MMNSCVVPSARFVPRWARPVVRAKASPVLTVSGLPPSSNSYSTEPFTTNPAWPSTHVADMADNVVHEFGRVHRLATKQDARAFYAQAFATLALTRIISQRRLYGPGFAVDEASVEAVTANGEPTGFQLLHVFEFTNGQISPESAWQAPLLAESAAT
jgi:hypothetical protein